MGRTWWWLAPLAVFLMVSTIWLLSLGSRGNEIADILGLPIAVVSLAVSIVLYQRGNREPRTTAGYRPWRVLLAVTVTVLLAATGVLAYWVVGQRSDVTVTADLTLSTVDPVGDGGSVTVGIPGTPPPRRNLALVLVLANPDPTGDCVVPAELTLLPVLDGKPRAGSPVRVRSGEEARLSLAGAVARAAVLVTYRLGDADPDCRVRVTVERAVLYH